MLRLIYREFLINFFCVFVLVGKVLGQQTLNSGGGWASGGAYTSFNVYGEVYQVNRVKVGKYNRPPDSLEKQGFLTVREGSRMGTEIGQFTGTDPDGDDLSYFLVSGDGDSGNRLFSLTREGTLLSKWSLQSQGPGERLIRVQASDRRGGSIEKIFSVKVLEGFLPIVDTAIPYITPDGRYWLGGEIVDPGMSPDDLDVGVLVSEFPIIDEEGDRVMKGKLYLNDDSRSFGIEFSPEQNMQNLYIVAFAKNEKGTAYGLQEKIKIESFGEPIESSKADLWTFAQQIDGAPGWWESLWFGTYYYAEESGWLLHLDLGWLFPSMTIFEGVWFWKDSLGWFWTDNDVYPYLYSSESESWLYFYGDLDQKRLLFDYSKMKWMKLDESEKVETEGAR